MNKIINMSTKQAIKYLNYNGPVFLYSPFRIDFHHKDYSALKKMVTAYSQGGK